MKSANFAGLLYWARSAVNAGAWLPCMLSLDGGQVELESERGVELRSPASDLVVEITGLSNLMVIATGGNFVLSAVGGRAVPLPLPSLQARLRAFREAHPGCPKESLIDPFGQWQTLLVAAGARERGRSRSRLRLLCAVAMCTLAVVLGSLGLLITWLALWR